MKYQMNKKTSKNEWVINKWYENLFISLELLTLSI